MKNAFIALALVLVVSTAFASLSSETKARLQKINSNAFGKTILETIQVELQTKDDPRPSIITLLQELEQELITDQQEADAAFSENESSNDDILDGIHEEQSSLEDNLSDWEDQQSDLEAELSGDEAELATNADLLDNYNAELDAHTAALETAQSTWDSANSRYGRILDVLGQVRAVITERLASRYNAEFIQTSHKQLLSNLAQVKENINAKSFKKSSPGFSKLAAFLAAKVETALKDDDDDAEVEAALTSVVTLIDSLAQGVESERTDAQAAFELAQSTFDDASSRLNNAISTTTAAIDNLDNQVTDLKARLATVTSDIASAASRLDDLNEQELTQEASFAQLQDAYRTSTHDRTDQLQLIQEVLEIVQNQLTGLRQYAEDYIGSH
jgi:chromosome segregation ATPase